MNLNLIRKMGLEALRVKTKEHPLVSKTHEVTSKVQTHEVGPAEVVIVTPKGTFRSSIFAYNKGEIVLDKSLPPELKNMTHFEVAIFTERAGLETTMISGKNQHRKRDCIFFKAAPVLGNSYKKIRINQMSLDDYKRMQDLLKKPA